MLNHISKKTVALALATVFLNCKEDKKATDSTSNNNEVVNTENKTVTYQDRFPYLLAYQVDSLSFPRSGSSKENTVHKVPSKDWTSGFFPGVLWQVYELTGDKAYLSKAQEWTAFVEQEKFNNRTHDMGFKVFCSFGTGYRLTPKEKYKEVIIESAKTLATRYNSTVGSIRSWDFNKDIWDFPVIVDNMMNLELLFEASILADDPQYKNIATQHAKTTLQNHFRPDGSIFHVVDYDPTNGKVRSKVTHQGFNDNSTWARGQGWGIYGFTMAYRYTKNQDFLNRAKATADFVMNHPRLPKDAIPYWDFDAPNIPNEPRDASAAAVIASAMVELFQYTNDQKYLDFSDKIMESLKSDYVITNDSNIPFLLDHSTGNWPKNDEIDEPISYADYYFLETVLRRKKLNIQ